MSTISGMASDGSDTSSSDLPGPPPRIVPSPADPAQDRLHRARKRLRGNNKLALLLLSLMVIPCGGILLAHLGRLFTQWAVSGVDGTYGVFVVEPIVLWSLVSLVAFIPAGIALIVHPAIRPVASLLLVMSAVLAAGANLWGFHVSYERQHPDAALTSVIRRLDINWLRQGPLVHQILNNDTPSVDRTWRGPPGALDCSALHADAKRDFPGAQISPAYGDGCGLDVVWNGTLTLIFTSMLASPTPVPTYVKVSTYLVS